MRYIEKQPAPAAFIAWKTKYGSDLNYKYELLDTEMKAMLKEALLNEQGGLCAYTGISIDQKSCHIEHLKAQKHCKAEGSGEDLDYRNIVACFPGPDEDKQCPFGAHPKADWPEPAERGNFVSPLNEGCEQKFNFSGKGLISANDKDAKADSPANQTIVKLRLNDTALDQLRYEAVAGMLEPKPGKKLNLEQARKRLQQLDNQSVLNGALDEFCFVLKQRLRAYIDILEKNQALASANLKPHRTKQK